jgi:hypothetical protein
VFRGLFVTSVLCLLALNAQAAPFMLTDAYRCSLGNQQFGIAIGDVTGNPRGGATDCWGAYTGNDPTGDGFQIGSQVFNYVAKHDIGTGLSGRNIGLTVTPTTASQSGTWAFDQGALLGRNFLVVLKAASAPGYAAWLFSGGEAGSYFGDWTVAWENDLSHLAIYEGDLNRPPSAPPRVPVPATPALLGLGLMLVRAVRRRR